MKAWKACIRNYLGGRECENSICLVLIKRRTEQLNYTVSTYPDNKKHFHLVKKQHNERLCLKDKIRPIEAGNIVQAANDFHPKGGISSADGMAGIGHTCLAS